jgi:site-specific DNA-methyltransferase (adenine-specific)
MPVDRDVGVLPGVLACTSPQGTNKRHQAQKPLDMMRQVVRICEPGTAVFDPFAGSGTTLIAATMEGHDAVGCEVSREIFHMAAGRLKEQIGDQPANAS